MEQRTMQRITEDPSHSRNKIVYYLISMPNLQWFWFIKLSIKSFLQTNSRLGAGPENKVLVNLLFNWIEHWHVQMCVLFILLLLNTDYYYYYYLFIYYLFIFYFICFTLSSYSIPKVLDLEYLQKNSTLWNKVTTCDPRKVDFFSLWFESGLLRIVRIWKTCVLWFHKSHPQIFSAFFLWKHLMLSLLPLICSPIFSGTLNLQPTNSNLTCLNIYVNVRIYTATSLLHACLKR